MITKDSYDFHSFTVAHGQTDRNIRSNESSLWNKVKVYRRVELRVDGLVTIKLNKTANPGITVDLIDSPYVIPFDIEITNLFISNSSGSTVTIKLMGTA